MDSLESGVPAEKHQIQKFRHRGFQPADGGDIIMMFNEGPEPLNPDQTPMKKLWDNDVEQHITVRKHVDVVGVPV